MDKIKQEINFKQYIEDKRKTWTKAYLEKEKKSSRVDCIILSVSQDVKAQDVLDVLKNHLEMIFTEKHHYIYVHYNKIYIRWGNDRLKYYCNDMINEFLFFTCLTILLVLVMLFLTPIILNMTLLQFKARIGATKIDYDYCLHHGYGFCDMYK